MNYVEGEPSVTPQCITDFVQGVYRLTGFLYAEAYSLQKCTKKNFQSKKRKGDMSRNEVKISIEKLKTSEMEK